MILGSLVGKSFELAIDDLHFLSYPCSPKKTTFPSLSETENTNNKVEEEKTKKTEISSSSSGGGGGGASSSQSQTEDILSQFNIVIATISGEAMAKVNRNFLYKCQCRYYGHPGEDPMSLLLGLRQFSYGICTPTLKRLLESCMTHLTILEKERGYVSREVSKMIAIAENFRHRQSSSSSSSANDSMVHHEIEGKSGQSPTTVIVVDFTRSRRTTNHSVTTESPHRSEEILVDIPISPPEPNTSELKQVSSDRSLTGQSYDHLNHLWRGELEALYMEKSYLANELRVLFHDLSGGQATNLTFSGMKKISHVPLVCKDPSTCRQSHSGRSRRYRDRETFFNSTIRDSQLTFSKDAYASFNKSSRGVQTQLIVNPAMQALLPLTDRDCIAQYFGRMGKRSISVPGGSSSAPANEGSQRNSLGSSEVPRIDESSRMYLLLKAANPCVLGLAEVIPLITEVSVFKVRSQAPLTANSRVSAAFDRLLKTIPILTKGQSDPGGQSDLDLSRHSDRYHPHTARSSVSGFSSHHTAASKTNPFLTQEVHNLVHSSNTDNNGGVQAHKACRFAKLSFPIRSKESKDPLNNGDLGVLNMDMDPESHPAPPRNTDTSIRFANSSSYFPSSVPSVPSNQTITSSFLQSERKLTQVLDLFDGMRPLKEVINLLPPGLRGFGVEITSFLLKWHMLEHIDSYLLNMLALPLPSKELTMLLDIPPSTVENSSKMMDGVQKNNTNSSNATRPEPIKAMSLTESVSFAANVIQAVPVEEKRMTILDNPWANRLSKTQQQHLELIASFFQSPSIADQGSPRGSVLVSNQTLNEIIFRTRIPEAEVVALLARLPYLKPVQKAALPYPILPGVI
eukprot:scaffold539_cov187-Ochromonas_danica.AAC.21